MVFNPLCSPDRPFVATIRPERYFPSASAERVRERLQRLVDRAEGIGVLIGDCGTGKTLLCRRLAVDAVGRYDVVLLAETRIRNRADLLRHILASLHLPYAGRSEAVLRQNLLDYLIPTPDRAEGLLLIADEGESLSRGALDELRILSGVVRDRQPRVRVILAGNLRLDETLSEPRMAPLAHRIAARCYLQPIMRSEVKAYVEHQLRVARWPADSIELSAIEAVARISDGNPRLINQLFDHAFALAADRGVRTLTGALINEAQAELEPLSLTIRNGDTQPVEGSLSSIEFGELAPIESPIEASTSESIAATEPPSPREEEANDKCWGAREPKHSRSAQDTDHAQRMPLISKSPAIQPAERIAVEGKLTQTPLPELPQVADPFGRAFVEEIILPPTPLHLRVADEQLTAIKSQQITSESPKEPVAVSTKPIRTFHLASDGPTNHVNFSELPESGPASSWFELGDDGDLLVIEEDLIEWQYEEVEASGLTLRPSR
jgi:type II secretory pathway predicted ATPase ExeA